MPRDCTVRSTNKPFRLVDGMDVGGLDHPLYSFRIVSENGTERHAHPCLIDVDDTGDRTTLSIYFTKQHIGERVRLLMTTNGEPYVISEQPIEQAGWMNFSF